MPEFGGMDKFKGESFHTAEWDQNANLKGKKVGIVGTGASAAQVITSIADEVESLTVFQRTASWAIEREDQPTPSDIIDAFKAGGYSSKLRHVDWKGENPPDPNLPFTFEQLHDEDWNSSVCELLSERIMNDVNDQELAKQLTPDYPFFCKRVLIIDDLIATGGTAEAAAKLVNISEGKISAFIFVINLFDLGGSDNLIKKNYKVENLIEFPGH